VALETAGFAPGRGWLRTSLKKVRSRSDSVNNDVSVSSFGFSVRLGRSPGFEVDREGLPPFRFGTGGLERELELVGGFGRGMLV
jgi:hypothetical protein